jgi:hypothetical protein
MTEVWSCGGGTQSGAIASLIRSGRLPRPDIAFMTDTGRENSNTWPFVDGFIRPALASVGLELNIIKATHFTSINLFSANGDVLLPGFTNLTGKVGKLEPFCSGKWKRDVAERWMRSIGIDKARNWIGISRDETSRIRSQHRPWLKLWYPLVFEVPMWRSGCVELIRSDGWTGKIPHSSCRLCPNHSNSQLREMKLERPEEFALVCIEEAEILEKDHHFFLHESCVPLAEVDFEAQTTMFPERGCTEGCFT